MTVRWGAKNRRTGPIHRDPRRSRSSAAPCGSARIRRDRRRFPWHVRRGPRHLRRRHHQRRHGRVRQRRLRRPPERRCAWTSRARALAVSLVPSHGRSPASGGRLHRGRRLPEHRGPGPAASRHRPGSPRPALASNRAGRSTLSPALSSGRAPVRLRPVAALRTRRTAGIGLQSGGFDQGRPGRAGLRQARLLRQSKRSLGEVWPKPSAQTQPPEPNRMTVAQQYGVGLYRVRDRRGTAAPRDGQPVVEACRLPLSITADAW